MMTITITKGAWKAMVSSCNDRTTVTAESHTQLWAFLEEVGLGSERFVCDVFSSHIVAHLDSAATLKVLEALPRFVETRGKRIVDLAIQESTRPETAEVIREKSGAYAVFAETLVRETLNAAVNLSTEEHDAYVARMLVHKAAEV